MLDIIKNPVIIGLTVGVLVHLYFKWEASKIENKDKNKRKDSNLLIPLFLGIAAWFIAHNYYEKYNFDEVISNNINNNVNYQFPEKLELSDATINNTDVNLLNNNFNNIQQQPLFNNIQQQPLFNNIQQQPLFNNIQQQPLFNNIQQQPTFHLLKKGVTIPNNITLPDVLLEKF